MTIRTILPTMMLALATGLSSGTALAAGPLFADGFNPGQYRLRALDDPRAAPASICLRSPDLLARPVHRHISKCTSRILTTEPDRATLHYRCDGHGWGRSVIRRETSSLFQIDTQGISGHAPFATRFEARRTGECEKAAHAKPRS